MISVLSWIVHKLGSRPLATCSLLLVVVGSASFALERMVRGLDRDLIWTVGTLALLAGWLLARSPLPGWLAAVVCSALGAEIVIARVGHLGPSLASVSEATLRFAWHSIIWSRAAVEALLLHPTSVPSPPSWSDVVLPLLNLLAAALTLLSRSLDWLAAIVRGQGAFDPAAAALVWSALIWTLVAWAGWAVRRRAQPLAGIMPLMALLAAAMAYSGSDSLWLLPVLAAALLLMPLVGHAAREQIWMANGIGFSEEVRGDLGIVTAFVTGGLVCAAALFPSLSVREIARAAEHILRQETGEAARIPGSLGLSPAPAPTTVFDSARYSGLPNEHLVGLSPERSKQVVMRVKTDDQGAGGQRAGLNYWRSYTYDRYSGRGWYANWTEVEDQKANEPAITVKGAAGRRVYQDVELMTPLPGPLYTMGQLITANRDYRLARRSSDDAFGANVGVSSYRAESWLATPDENQLQQAAANYPDSVLRTYLQLPADVPPRVLALARDLTATGRTPYDRARAIEGYLRQFPYTLEVPLPPPGRDVADYFLFDLQRGYCDYYATAMVVLSRASAIPARLVVGYAGGSYDPVHARFDITAGDAHAWVEIYFPGYGWVEFEPTADRAEIDRDELAALSRQPGPTVGSTYSGTSARPVGDSRVGWLSAAAFLGAVLSLAGWFRWDEERLRRLSPAAAAHAIYGRVLGNARALEVGVCPGDTPYQVADRLSSRFAELARDPHSLQRQPQVRRRAAVKRMTDELRAFIQLYVEVVYGRQGPNINTRLRMIQEWKRLRGGLWQARFWQLAGRARVSLTSFEAWLATPGSRTVR